MSTRLLKLDDPKKARELRDHILHFALRGAITYNRPGLIEDVVTAWPRFNLNRTYGYGPLLFYAAQRDLLACDKDALRPFLTLLKLGASTRKSFSYYLDQNEYERGRHMPLQGTIHDYFVQLESELMQGELASQIDPLLKVNILNNMNYLFYEIDARPPLTRKKPVFEGQTLH